MIRTVNRVKGSKRSIALSFLVLSLFACGSKTGLRVWDAGFDADVPEPEDVFERFEACVPGRFTMVRRSAEILFVVDRSGSMFQPLEQGATRRRWDALSDALAVTLPRYERAVEFGVMFYPRVPENSALGNIQGCDLTPGGIIDVQPSPRNASVVMSAYRAFWPQGGTPTAAAVRRAAGYLASRTTRGRARYIVLATDGAPNCNRDLDTSTCLCMNPAGCPGGPNGSQMCLDDVASIEAIRQARANSIFTYVIGLDGDIPLMFLRVLNEMADAGGRPFTGTTRYISIRSDTALRSALDGIQRTVVQCSFVTPSRPDDPDQITVFLNGRPVPRDEGHTNGWDWSDRDYGEVALYGDACNTIIASEVTVTAQVGCLDR